MTEEPFKHGEEYECNSCPIKRKIKQLQAEKKSWRRVAERLESKCKQLQAKIEKLEKATALLNSMILGREKHTDELREIVKQALNNTTDGATGGGREVPLKENYG